MFTGWPEEALEFFEGLEADNSKSYWTAHKASYDTAVLAPMQELVATLQPEWGGGRIMRPYRDIRFSKDKSPYKTFIAAMVGPGYVSLNARTFGCGSGIWEVGPDMLERYRSAVAAEAPGEALVGVVNGLRDRGVGIMSHEALKSAPKGYAKDHPRIELLRMKGIAAWQEWPAGAWLGTPAPAERVAGFLRAAAPLTEWLREHVGERVGAHE